MEFIFHSLVYVLCCGIFAGVFVIVKNTLKKEKNGIVLAFVIALGSWVVLFVWVMPVTVLPQPFSYILKGIIVIAEIIAIVKTMRIGLRSNKYE